MKPQRAAADEPCDPGLSSRMLMANRLRTKVRKAAVPIGSWILIASLWPLSFGCRGFLDSDTADAKWREDYARCRFGMTPERLEASSESPSREPLRQNPAWEACLDELGWETRARSSFGPQWDD